MGTWGYILYMNYQNVTHKQNVLAKKKEETEQVEKRSSHT